jgi:predicted RNase H-like nuclease (RuvC/YqgF family)
MTHKSEEQAKRNPHREVCICDHNTPTNLPCQECIKLTQEYYAKEKAERNQGISKEAREKANWCWKEIEGLGARLSTIKTCSCEAYKMEIKSLEDIIETLKAENQRLRDALEKYRKTFLSDGRNWAEEALAEGKQKIK